MHGGMGLGLAFTNSRQVYVGWLEARQPCAWKTVNEIEVRINLTGGSKLVVRLTMKNTEINGYT